MIWAAAVGIVEKGYLFSRTEQMSHVFSHSNQARPNGGYPYHVSNLRRDLREECECLKRHFPADIKPLMKLMSVERRVERIAIIEVDGWMLIH